jgi:hypothetical protein
MQFSDAFAFLKDVTAGGSNRNLAVIPNTNIPVSVETIEIILIIQIVLLQIQITLVHTTLMVLDLQSILMDKQSKMTASASGLDITHTESN